MPSGLGGGLLSIDDHQKRTDCLRPRSRLSAKRRPPRHLSSPGSIPEAAIRRCGAPAASMSRRHDSQWRAALRAGPRRTIDKRSHPVFALTQRIVNWEWIDSAK